MILYPAIDIFDGECVRLRQGDFKEKTVYYKNPVDAAKKWVDQGAQWLHVVDLNGALEGKPVNIKAVEEIMTTVAIPVQIGGGIRTQDTAEIYLTLGAGRVIIGSTAMKDPDLVQILCAKYNERIVVGLDAKDGKVAVHGWQELLDKDAFQFAQEFEGMGLQHIIYTDISRDGLLEGPNFESIKKMAASVGIPVIASAGIHSLEDIRKLKAMGVEGAVLGKALYENKFSLTDALKEAE